MPGSWLGSLLAGFALGGSLIIAIGAQNAYVLRQGLERQHVFAVATLCAACDLTLIVIGVAGFGALVTAFPGVTAVAAWGGAVFLFVYGLHAFRSALRPGTLESGSPGSYRRQSLRTSLLTVLALTLLNPHVYLDTVVLIGSVAAQHPGARRTAFGAGAVLASMVWFYALGHGAAALAPLFRKSAAWRALDIAVGIVMWSIAAALVANELNAP